MVVESNRTVHIVVLLTILEYTSTHVFYSTVRSPGPHGVRGMQSVLEYSVLLSLAGTASTPVLEYSVLLSLTGTASTPVQVLRSVHFATCDGVVLC